MRVPIRRKTVQSPYALLALEVARQAQSDLDEFRAVLARPALPRKWGKGGNYKQHRQDRSDRRQARITLKMLYACWNTPEQYGRKWWMTTAIGLTSNRSYANVAGVGQNLDDFKHKLEDALDDVGARLWSKGEVPL